jgi:hypothetical protein
MVGLEPTTSGFNPSALPQFLKCSNPGTYLGLNWISYFELHLVKVVAAVRPMSEPANRGIPSVTHRKKIFCRGRRRTPAATFPKSSPSSSGLMPAVDCMVNSAIRGCSRWVALAGLAPIVVAS